jgi:16S rRNA (cytidine1402-2'-O)-methyltransferase
MNAVPWVPGSLHLLPVPISDGTASLILPARTCAAAQSLRCFVVENARSARRALRDLGHPGPLQDLEIVELPLHKDGSAPEPDRFARLLAPLAGGISIGLMSESGCPGIADPGALLVRWAQAHGYPVIAHVGPSSLLLALMGSGLEGQRFSFHGYLPVEGAARAEALRALELRSVRERAAQLFIETPYRNGAMCAALLATLQAQTHLTIATDLTGSAESLRTRSIAEWRTLTLDLPRLPTVFVLQGASAPDSPLRPPGQARPGGQRPPRPNAARPRRA